jgi:DNA-directed RNA polymerase subunit RPC12/RpoP
MSTELVLQELAPEKDHGLIYCPKCGFKIPDSVIICWKCGNRINT